MIMACVLTLIALFLMGLVSLAAAGRAVLAGIVGGTGHGD